MAICIFSFSRLCKLNTFREFFLFVRNKFYVSESNKILIIDSTFIQNKFGKQHIGRNKFFKSKNCNKISLISDSNGVPISFHIGLGNVHDINLVDYHFDDLVFLQRNKHCHLLADKGYVSKCLQNNLKSINCSIMTPKKSNMINNICLYDANMYKKRINIEHTFSHLKSFKRIQLRYDAYLNHYYSFVYLALVLLVNK
jgi:transposase